MPKYNLEIYRQPDAAAKNVKPESIHRFNSLEDEEGKPSLIFYHEGKSLKLS